MKKVFLQYALAALLLLALPHAAVAADGPAYPGETINGTWVSISGTHTFDVKAGVYARTTMEGDKSETPLTIISDDGKVVVFTEDGTEWTVTIKDNGSADLAMKGREKFPTNMTKDK